MKRRGIVVLAIVGIICAPILLPAAESDAVYLRRDWSIRSSADLKEGGQVLSSESFNPSGWHAATVPNTVLAILLENKIYPDPFYGLNLKTTPGYRKAPWLVMPENSPFKKSWWYRTAFPLPQSFRGKNLCLHLDGINYRANVWFNGKLVGESKDLFGMFQRFEINVTEHARPGAGNVLAVEVIPPGQIPDITYRTKQMEATTGWDDHNPFPPDMNMGLWRDVYVTATGPVTIKHPYVATRVDLPSLANAHLTITAELSNLEKKEVAGELKGVIENITFAQKLKLAPGETRLVKFSPTEFKQLNLGKPRLWWPNLYGSPELYDLKLAFSTGGAVSHERVVRFGIREATTYINDEGWRGYMINGKKILVRGGAWMTSDMLLRLTPRRYDALVRYAREGNLNMLRSEGFSVRETDEFYDLCDKYGIMVTQQIFGRSIPDEALAVRCAEDTIRRIRNHPSLVHFLGHDETFPTPTLDKAYRELVAKYTPERTYQPHSGAFDVKERFETGGTRTGTRELWTYATPNQYYTFKPDGAWGFAQSGGIGGVITPIESLRKMMPEKDLWPLWTDALSFHTVTQGGTYFDALVKALNRRYGAASGIEDFVTKGQALNYESARGMFEAYGRNKYAATGITTWKYDAAWPAWMTWQYVDWYLRVGGAYYAAKKACEPYHIQYSYDDQSVWAVNGSLRELRGMQASVRLLDFSLKERFNQTRTIDVAPDGKTEVLRIQTPSGLSKTYFVSLELRTASGNAVSRNFYWLSTQPDTRGKLGADDDRLFYTEPLSTADMTALATLPKVQIRPSSSFVRRGGETVGKVTLSNNTGHLAFMVRLMVTKGPKGEEVLPSYWDDNYVCLLPGEKRQLEVVFATEELGGATPAVQLSGWNAAQ